jgi:hypothetical protein
MRTHGWRRWAVSAIAGLAVVAPARATGGDAAPALQVTLRALTDSQGTELSVTAAFDSGEPAAPSKLTHVRIKMVGLDGSLEDVVSLTDVPLAGGRGAIDLPVMSRGQRLEAQIEAQDEQTGQTIMVEAETTALLRPDLRVENVLAPQSVLSGRAFSLSAEVAELDGDVGLDATAVVTRADTNESLGTTPLHVDAGGSAVVELPVALEGSGPIELRLDVVNPSIDEAGTDNNAGSTTVEVTEFEVNAGATVLPVLAGYGGQFNHSLFLEPLNPSVPPGAPALREKLDTLEPQLARIFFPREALTEPERLDSFAQAVAMAQETGAIINVTWVCCSGNVESNMSRFAGVLADLVTTRGMTNLRWVTLLNEPNSTAATLSAYEQMYRSLDVYLKAAGVRDQIRFMGGDLVREDQLDWFRYMAEHMADVLDAYSIHVFWDYWDTAKLQARLDEVQAIVHDLGAPKPVYASEYGVRGIRRPGGSETTLLPAPGVFSDGTPMAETRISAFQLGWFDVYSSRLGYPGTLVWDLFNAKYDNGTQDFSCIGPAPDFELRPCYFLLRLFTATTEPGWRVVGVDGEAGLKLLTAYAGDGGLLTVVGLDRAGGQLNDASGPAIPYSVGGLPPLTTFRLVIWNRDGDGTLTSDESVTTDAAGVAWLTVPEHAIWSLTTHPIFD